MLDQGVGPRMVLELLFLVLLSDLLTFMIIRSQWDRAGGIAPYKCNIYVFINVYKYYYKETEAAHTYSSEWAKK